MYRRVHRHHPASVLLDALQASQDRVDAEIRNAAHIKVELIQRHRDELARHILSVPHGDEEPTRVMPTFERVYRLTEARLMHRRLTR